MILPDVNVLVYAFRDDTENHRACRAWLDSLVDGDSAYGISPQVLGSVVRICTHPGIFPNPSQLNQTLTFCDVLIGRPQCQLIYPGPRHWSLFTGLCRRVHATGNLVQDAWFAALAIEHGCEWITSDRHYSRFPGLTWRTLF
ncbi:MAG TPA: type II toxin-antitoxin system VapC family toxin [Terriglobia bacterium]|nr:type II toxin-antitoxin system VapC family toxin [Terriglobia bacterium]